MPGVARPLVVLAVASLLLLSGCIQRAEAAAPPPHAQAAAGPSPVPAPLSGRRIMLDPGHGAHTGAVSADGHWEDDNVLDIAQRTAALLRADGATVALTRMGPNLLGRQDAGDLQVRVADAVAWHADVLVSLHENWSTDSSLRGVETFWETPSSAPLARTVQHGLVTGTDLEDQGVAQRDFWVVSCVPMPAVLVEVGYLSNVEEAALISGPAFHAREAQALRGALDDDLTQPGVLRGIQPAPPTGVQQMCALDPISAKGWLQRHPEQ